MGFQLWVRGLGVRESGSSGSVRFLLALSALRVLPVI